MSNSEYNREKLFGRLHNQAVVELDPESLSYTTLWTCDQNHVASLQHDSELSMKVLHGLCNEYNQPFIIDVGAHIGTCSLVGALCDNVRGWSFEPNIDAFNIMKRNININSMNGRFTLFNKALTNRSGKCALRIPVNKVNSHLACIGYPNYRHYFEQVVESVTLDEIMERAEIDSVDIMRIDTEGSELPVLLGASDTISKFKPDLLLKYNWFKCAQSEIFGDNLLNYLAVLGYQTSWVGDEDLLCRHPGRNRHRIPERFNKWGEEISKIAIVKQKYDDFGPWQNELYDPATPLKVLDKWPARYTYFEMSQLFKADWYVVPYCHDSRIVRQKIEKYRSVIDANVSGVTSIQDIPVGDYDVVISLDPILRPLSSSKTVFAYLQNEHHDSEYLKSIKNPLHGYDLFLDHMLEAPDWVYNLPQALAFPYTRDPGTVRTLRSKLQDNSIWIDNRLVMMLAHGSETCHDAFNVKILHNLEREIGARFRFRQANFTDIQQLQTSYLFLQELSQSKYYLSLIACGAGQGLGDAASLGLICFGTPKLKYHMAICHPSCLCNDLIDFKRKFNLVSNSPDLQQEILAWQDLMLADKMVRLPMHMLEAAVDMKRRKVSKSSPPRQSSHHCAITSLEVGAELPEIGKINYVKLKNMAKSEFEAGNYSTMIDFCMQALYFNADDTEVYFLLACAYYAMGNKLKALENLGKSENNGSTYNPADHLLNLIGEDYVEETYRPYLENYDCCINRLRRYMELTLINEIDDFDVANIGIYDEIINELSATLIKSNRYETDRLMIYHLGKQLKTVVAAEIAA